MKIFILRHEDRLSDCTLYAPLSKIGLINSKNLISILNEYNINFILSSPFIRTLQTILPYSKQKNIKINIEYGLSEIYHQDIIPLKSSKNTLSDYIAELFNYNNNYKSNININDINYPEKYSHVMNRTIKTIKYIISQYWNTDYNIILVTHQSVCKCLLEIINKSINCNINEKYLDNYPTGKLCLIFEEYNWICKFLN